MGPSAGRVGALGGSPETRRNSNFDRVASFKFPPLFSTSATLKPGRDGADADHQIPDARASGFIFPIPAKSGFPISRIRDSGQIGIPDFPNPGFRPNRDARFPEIRDSGQIGIQIRENPDFF
jgi:hypothetical protein